MTLWRPMVEVILVQTEIHSKIDYLPGDQW
jgi:hypothetical protein